MCSKVQVIPTPIKGLEDLCKFLMDGTLSDSEDVLHEAVLALNAAIKHHRNKALDRNKSVPASEQTKLMMYFYPVLPGDGRPMVYSVYVRHVYLDFDITYVPAGPLLDDKLIMTIRIPKFEKQYPHTVIGAPIDMTDTTEESTTQNTDDTPNQIPDSVQELAELREEVRCLKEEYKQLNHIVMLLHEKVNVKPDFVRGLDHAFGSNPNMPTWNKPIQPTPPKILLLDERPITLDEVSMMISSIPEFNFQHITGYRTVYSIRDQIISAIQKGMSESSERELHFLFLPEHLFCDPHDDIQIRIIPLRCPIVDLTLSLIESLTLSKFTMPKSAFIHLKQGNDFVVLRTYPNANFGSGSFYDFHRPFPGFGFDSRKLTQNRWDAPFVGHGRHIVNKTNPPRGTFFDLRHFAKVFDKFLEKILEECRSKKKSRYTSLMMCFGINGTWDASEKCFMKNASNKNSRPLLCMVDSTGMTMGSLTRKNGNKKQIAGPEDLDVLRMLSPNQIIVVIHQMEKSMAETFNSTPEEMSKLRVTTDENQTYWCLNIESCD